MAFIFFMRLIYCFLLEPVKPQIPWKDLNWFHQAESRFPCYWKRRI